MVNKKGDVTESVYFLVIIFFLAVSFVVVAFVMTKFSYVVGSTALNQSQVASQIETSLDYMSTTTIQRSFVILFAFSIIAMMVSAFLVRVHPIWLFVYIIVLATSILLAVPLANTYNTLISIEPLDDIANQQTAMNYIMRHIVQILIGAMFISWIILFSKPQDGGPI